jgi:hypothetical protein
LHHSPFLRFGFGPPWLGLVQKALNQSFGDPAWKVSYAQLNINDVHVNVMAVHVNVMVPKDVGHSVPWGET